MKRVTLRYIPLAIMLLVNNQFAINVNAQEKVPLDYREISSYSCRSAIEKAKQKLKKYDLQFYTMRMNISDFYDDAPNGKIISFWLEDRATMSILASEVFMLDLSKNIIYNCTDDRIYLVEFALYRSGYSEAFGLLNEEVQHFEIVTSPNCRGKWGTNCNT